MRAWGRSVLVGSSLALAACAGEPGGPGGGEGTATIRMLNAATGSGSLDLVVGGQLIAGAVDYERASVNAAVPGGTQVLNVRRSGEQAVLASKSAELQPGGKYSLVVSGSLTSLVLTSTAVGDTGAARPDRANLRLINISTIVIPQDSSQMPPPIPLDVYITTPGLALAGLFPNLSLDARVSSYSTLLYFDPGTFQVRFVTPGTTTVVAEAGPIVMAAGAVRAVTLSKQGDGTWKTAVVVEQ